MRIYNNTNSQIEFDLTPSRKIVIPAHQYSGNFLPNTDTLERLVKVFTPNQIAFLASGTVELNLCANVNSTVIGNFVHTSFDEISEKFNLEGAKKEEEKEEKKAESEEAAEKGVLKEKVIEAAPEPEKESVVEDAPVAEPEATTPKKSSRKKKKE
jgi:hypothetical protein